MKKNLCITFFVLVIIIATAVCAANLGKSETGGGEYLRIHVRADSNLEADQAVKYKVKDEVVKFITPYAAQCTSKERAVQIISSVLDEIEEVCDKVLRQNGFAYTSKAQIRAEKFPTRVYGGLTLEEGVYDALIIELGSGSGDNWWCVIYPPLCFTSGGGKVEYRSAIYDIVRKFFDKD